MSLEVRDLPDDATWQKDEQEITGGKVRVLQARGNEGVRAGRKGAEGAGLSPELWLLGPTSVCLPDPI